MIKDPASQASFGFMGRIAISDSLLAPFSQLKKPEEVAKSVALANEALRITKVFQNMIALWYSRNGNNRCWEGYCRPPDCPLSSCCRKGCRCYQRIQKEFTPWLACASRLARMLFRLRLLNYINGFAGIGRNLRCKPSTRCSRVSLENMQSPYFSSSPYYHSTSCFASLHAFSCQFSSRNRLPEGCTQETLLFAPPIVVPGNIHHLAGGCKAVQ